MKVSATNGGLTLRVIAGTHSVILAMDMDEASRAGCLGFSIHRTHLGPSGAPLPAAQQEGRWLPTLLRFPQDANAQSVATDRAPIQKFRWGDYTTTPGDMYRYQVTARYGAWNALTDGASVAVEVTTENPANPETAVFFNRAAAASEAYNIKFPNTDPATSVAARTWLSRGLEEALQAFLAQATGAGYALHAAIYEFQKPELLQGLKAAMDRGADVQVVYHFRNAGDKDHTWTKNQKAAEDAGLAGVSVQRKANPPNAISHNKFVVLLKDGAPQAVWTGSTNWTEGALYGQLNVGHAVYDPAVAATYEQYFQLLRTDPSPDVEKAALAKLTAVPQDLAAGAGIYPLLSPQPDMKMIDLYAAVAKRATCLLVCAPFAIAEPIANAFKQARPGTLHFILEDRAGNLGADQGVTLTVGDANTDVEMSVATTRSSPLHDYQNRILADHESFHHAGVHIHAKIIAADPFGPDPIIITGSANFSQNSTVHNDSNSLALRGHTSVADIYATEFMRMFDHYLARGLAANAAAHSGLAEDDRWSARYYVPGSKEALGRQLFAGTLA